MFLNLWYLILITTLITSTHSLKKLPKSKPKESSEESQSYESNDNPNQRSIGFGSGLSGGGSGGGGGNAAAPRRFKFYPTPQPNWTQSPEMIAKLKARGFQDEFEDADKDYFAHYDFEFAKSGSIHPNFQQKYLKQQEKAVALEKQRKAQVLSTPPPKNEEVIDIGVGDYAKDKKPSTNGDNSQRSTIQKSVKTGNLVRSLGL